MKTASLLLFAFSLLFSSCSSEKSTQDTSEGNKVALVQNLSPKEFQEKSPNGVILDVRTPQEVAQGKLANAVVLDYYQANFLDKALEIPKDKEIYIYCAVGARSLEAAQLLIQQGYTKVYHLQGGIQAWYQNGLPIE
ncbi:MAG: rhodanese-like domain-containing protein [Algoriphagus aquaeductus]|uniref:rhodanese-like domain-containing protein n=1 Tax=Algoriphagus aquaeductus TaxID=475299 RepID=UPI00391DA1CE